MPVVVEIDGIKIKVNAKDHPPAHCHVEGLGAKVRINLKTLEQMDDTDFSPSSMKKIRKLVKQNLDELKKEWEAHHGKKEV
jgi:hypothetical protein